MFEILANKNKQKRQASGRAEVDIALRFCDTLDPKVGVEFFHYMIPGTHIFHLNFN